MKIFRFVFFFTVTMALFILLDNPYKGIPPLGKLLSPHQGYLQNAEKDSLTLPEQITLEGIQSEVTIQFDELLIPHISAQNEEDLYFAQGYVTAYHRLWQMEMQLYKTAGRISELLGADFLDFDKQQRRKGLLYGAYNTLEELQKVPQLYGYLEAYTRGVNSYISSLDPGNYPIEYKLLNYAPEPWTTFKCALLLTEMADQLSRGEADLENTNALKLWGEDTFNLLYPEDYPDVDPVIPAGTSFDFKPVELKDPGILFPLDFTKPVIDKPHPGNGSNSFIVNGNKTRDGSVYLANEPDLGLNLPSIWYLVHLITPDQNVMGATLPGTPFVVIGFNDSIAWGMTNAKRDLVDWYNIEFKNDKREEYRYDNKWLKTQKIVERFKVKDGDPQFDTIVYTHYGPVTYDRNFPLSDEKELNLAMRWTAHDPSIEHLALYKLNKAKNFHDFLEAGSYFTGPPQNISFASVAGNIGIQITGKFPVKWERQGKFLMDGSDSRQEWKTMMPYEHIYRTFNPAQNFASSANQHPGDSLYPYYDYDYNFEYYRNRRINDRLKVLNNIDEKDMMKLQHDNFNYIAFESLPMMLDSLDSASLTPLEAGYYESLKEWDYFNDPDRVEPSMFETWWDILYELTWDEIDSIEVSLLKPNTYNTIHLYKNHPDLSFFDIISTPQVENSTGLFRKSFTQAVETLEKWKDDNGGDLAWYKFKNTTIDHLLRIEPFSVSKIRIGGNHSIVNAATEDHGPSWRMVVKLTKEGIQAWGVYPGSQSGNPGNPTYAHMIENWANGNYHQLKFSRNLDQEDIKYEITLNRQSK